MKTFLQLILVAVFGLALTIMAQNQRPVPREELWKQVAEAESKGRPKTAVEILEKIISSARTDEEYPEAVKALAKKITFDGQIQGYRAEEQIVRLEAVIEEWPEDARPILETIQAHWYWSYFQQNQWRFLQRTQTGESPGDDIETWDLPRILAEIEEHFTAALKAHEQLKKIPIADWDGLLAKGSAPDSYRPTLFDFIAFEALRFYASGEQAGSQAADAFTLSAETPVFDTLDKFLAWEIKTTDEDSLKVKALRLYQQLLSFHVDDDNPDARLDADLGRLEYGYAQAYGEEKNARYKGALKRFVDENADHQISARARANWATVLRGEEQLVEAHAIAKQGADAFPNTPGGNRCANIVTQIEHPSSTLSVERVWNNPLPEVSVSYRNLTKVYFRVYSYDWDALRKKNFWNLDYLNDDKEQRRLIAAKPVREWDADLPETEDYHEREERIAVPDDLDPGFYYIISSHDAEFTQWNDNTVHASGFWVSDLALVMRSSHQSPTMNGFVLDAVSGEPIEGAKVSGWRLERNNRSVPIRAGKTDKNGLFKLSITPGTNHIFVAEHNGHRVSTMSQFSTGRSTEIELQQQTYFFTDRSIYRPGQSIHYKGLCVSFHQGKNEYKTLADTTITAVFNDSNGQEIIRKDHRTNEFGSFSGSFTAPRDRLMGRMSIQAVNGPNGYGAVTVEEYKRPKFKVEIEPPAEAAKLNEEVAVKGLATAYTGAPIDGASVSYRVVREVRYPDWWGWCFWWRSQHTQSQEISHGVTTTDVDGSFDVTFTAKPDPQVLEEDEPTFQFSVYADVTDSAGETRSAQTVTNVGYTALRATISAGDWQEKGEAVEIAVSTTSLDGKGLAAKGKIKVYTLKQPDEVERAKLQSNSYYHWRKQGKPAPDPSNPNSWENEQLLAEKPFETAEDGSVKVDFELEGGIYRAILETQDAFGKAVQAQLPLNVFDRQAKNFGIKIPFQMASPKWTLEPGETFSGLWGSGYDKARAFVEIHHRGKPLVQYWTEDDRTQSILEHEIGEELRGGFQVMVTMIRENRAYHQHRKVTVPWTNKQLQVKWERHRSKLEPGSQEKWSAIVSGPNAEKVVAEVAAALYDESLDAYLPHNWMQELSVFYNDYLYLSSQFQNRMNRLNPIYGTWNRGSKSEALSYRQFPNEILYSLRMFNRRMAKGSAMMMDGAAPPAPSSPALSMAMSAGEGAPEAAKKVDAQALDDAVGDGQAQPKPDLDQVSARTNLNETAFFFPHLTSQADGSVKLDFTMPEALTSWKFLAFAHDAELRSGFLTDSVVTAKDLMVQPNPPRFLREGDTLEFTVKVVNQSDAAQKGVVRLTLSDARTLDSVDPDLGNLKPEMDFEIPAKQSQSFSWKLHVPDGQGFLIYKAVASTGKLSDGEEGFLPVLPRRILVTESLPLPIRGKGEKNFEFEKLIASNQSNTIQHQSLTVQMVSNPSWYAVMALPYLMEFPHECSEQIFNRYYANNLGKHIVDSDPKIERVFEQWRGTDALDSPMEKNQDLKQVMLEETPWVRQANNESEARRNVGILFEENRMNDELNQSFKKLADRQLGNGLWPWFPGGRGNEYITLYITTGFGRLRHLNVDEIDVAPAVKSLNKLDAWIDEIYRDILKTGNKELNHLSPLICYYLYSRSFFLEDREIGKKHQEAVKYFQGQAQKYWVKLQNRQNQAHIAIALQRFGVHAETSKDIMISLDERSVSDEELGMFWRDTELNYWWYRAPIETQAMMIEAFDEVAKDDEAVEDLKVWLLKQKQTQDWKTTKATADAIYALLLRGADLLASDDLVEVSLGGEPIVPEKVEAGTGFYEQRFGGGEIEANFGEVKVTKVDDGVSWGSLHWQYFESIENITPHEGTPLTLKKTLWVKENGDNGPVLRAVKPGDKLKVGEQLLVRIELRTDRDMEYIHMKDQRGSGTEPTNVLSRYRYQDGLGYYESTRDTASHFFIDYLPKGTYIFEYGLRVFHRGEYQSGMTNIQCMYAPEFNSHSQSFKLLVE
ncbi:MAG: hypothetical protein ACI8UO_001270 [Verrucomicrobiales bacterium]